MMIFEGKNGNQLYLKTLKYILQNGKQTNPRGLLTKELYPALTKIELPQERFLSCYGRNINPFFLTAEALWILAGKGDVEWISYYNSKLKEYDDGSPNFHGAYGMRLRRYGTFKDNTHMLWRGYGEIDQFKSVINKLKKDKYTRQAVMCLWNPFFDNSPSKDYPCNNLTYLKIRNNKLHLHQILRSNDVNLGLYPTNVFQWSMVQEYLASALGLKMGHLLFYSDSLHCYLNPETRKLAKQVLKTHRPRRQRYVTLRNVRESNVTLGVRDSNVYDVYAYLHPCSMVTAELEVLDSNLHGILENIEEYKQGNFDISLSNSNNPLLESIELMLKIYSLRKHNRILESIENTHYIPALDFRVMAYQYAYNKAKNDTKDRDWIIHFCKLEKLHGKLIHFIKHGG